MTDDPDTVLPDEGTPPPPPPPNPEVRAVMPGTVINPARTGTITMGPSGSELTVTCQVTNWACVPSSADGAVEPTFCEDTPTVIPQKSAWVVSFAYLQDWGATDSLSEMLLANDAAEIDFTFTPLDTSVKTCSGTCYGRAGQYGGAASEAWVASGELPVVGTPTFAAQP